MKTLDDYLYECNCFDVDCFYFISCRSLTCKMCSIAFNMLIRGEY